MTRKDFLGDMLKNIFGYKTIRCEYTQGNTIRYKVAASILKDCTYSKEYRLHICNIILRLFETKYTRIFIDGGKNNGYHEITTYQNAAKYFIISLLVDDTVDCSKSTFDLRDTLTLPILEKIYTTIIYEIFNVNANKCSKDCGQDLFDQSKEKIIFDIKSCLNLNDQNIFYEDNFFNNLVKEHPIFSRIDFDTGEDVVKEDLKQSMSIIPKCSNPVVDLFECVENKKLLLERNSNFSVYGDIEKMTADNFWLMANILQDLCLNAQSYCIYLNLEEILMCINTAVRLYNKFYGKKRPKYVGGIDREAWNAHKFFTDYLFCLDWTLNMVNDKKNVLENVQTAECYNNKQMEDSIDDKKNISDEILKLINSNRFIPKSE